MSLTIEPRANPSFDWKLWPETEAKINHWVHNALNGHAFAAQLSARMHAETNTRFTDWVDHLVVSERSGLLSELASLGYERQPFPYALGAPLFAHPGGVFPRIIPARGDGPEIREVAIKVESVSAFSRAHDLGLEILGYPLGPYRVGRVSGQLTSLAVIERRAYLGFDPFPGELAREGRLKPHAARDTLAALDLWEARRRNFDDDQSGFDSTDQTLDRVIELAGSPDLACHLVFESERHYWQSRNRAAQIQKARQDRLGLGWANHDHHTFRSSRRFFPRLMRIFKALGFQLRERFHAGEQAGWGAQILEHPTTGIVIFADLDLAPDEASQDFTRQALPDLSRPNTVGLWVGLHGESILGAGMHHLEAQFNFEGLRQALKTESQIDTMPPFSSFPFLHQAFTAGERWPVDKQRADRLLKSHVITPDQHARFLREGAIGSHLENLQRGQGYKGFNQKSVGAILAATDPRLH